VVLLSGIVLDCGLDNRRFEFWQGLGIFLSTTASRPALGLTQPPLKRITETASPGDKAAGA